MKLLTLASLMCAVTMTAAESVWDGTPGSVASGSKDTKIEVKDNAIVMTGMSSPASYSYLIARVKTAPFSLKDKSFSFTVTPTDSQAGDTIYVKGIGAGLTTDKNGKKAAKTVFSFVAYKPAPGTYVVTPGKDCPPFKWIPAQVNVTTDEPVVVLQLFQGRKASNSAMGVTFKDLQTVDRK